MIKNEIKAVIFDMDGVITATEEIYYHAWQTALQEQGILIERADYITLFVGKRTADCEQILRERFNGRFDQQRFHSRWPKVWDSYVATHGIELKQGLLPLLALLEEKEIPKAIATSSDQKEAAKTLKPHQLWDRFPIIVTGEDVQNGKPAPDIYLKAAALLQVEPKHCLILEDSIAGIKAASAAGAMPVMIPDLVPPTAEVEQLAFRIYPSLLDVIDLLAIDHR